MNKFHAQPEVVDNIRFASRKESRRYNELKLLMKAGEIRALAVHPTFDLLALNLAGDSETVGRFTLDFGYFDKQSNAMVYEDVKGGRATKTEAYQLRKRILKANYGIEIREV